MAVNLPLEQRQEIHAAAAPLRDVAPWVGWIPAEKLHMTIKFLGEQPEPAVEPMGVALRAAAREHAVIDLAGGGIGAFPNFRRPHVVWFGVEAHPRLELLHHDVEIACERLGVEVEGTTFRPHLTLGRIVRRPPVEARRALAAARRQVTYRTEIRVESIDLMQSELLPGGARHTLVAAAPLRVA